jgi:hypothetical protein
MFLHELQEMLVDRLEDGFSKQIRFGVEISEQLSFGDISGAGHSGGCGTTESRARKLFRGRAQNTIENLFTRSTRSPNCGVAGGTLARLPTL